jgi:hypothetical protein
MDEVSNSVFEFTNGNQGRTQVLSCINVLPYLKTGADHMIQAQPKGGGGGLIPLPLTLPIPLQFQ